MRKGHNKGSHHLSQHHLSHYGGKWGRASFEIHTRVEKWGRRNGEKWGRASFGGLRSLPGFFQGFVLGALFED